MPRLPNFRCLVFLATLLTTRELFAAILVTNLACENRTNPLGVDVPQPRLSWALQSPVRGDKQTAYQILVASSQALLDQNTGDLWDSGQIISDAQNQNSYGGTALQTSQPVFWKARVWDANNVVSSWSFSATWTMGVMNPADWQAQWIMGVQRQSIGYHAQTSSSQSTTKWVQVDLGAAYPITNIRLHPKWHQGISGYGFPVRFRIQISNDPTFASATTIADQTGADYTNPRYFPVPFAVASVSARYVRVTATKLYLISSGNYGFALSQLEVVSGGTNVALNSAVSCLDTIEQFGWGAAGLTDGAGFVGCDYGRRLRREFMVQPGLKRAIAHITGLGQYELFVNGTKHGTDLLAPGWSAYGKTVLYDTRDITAQLQDGTNNAIGLVLGNGMYNIGSGFGSYRYVKFTQSFGPLRAIVQLQLDYTNGTSQIVTSDASWQTGPGAITFENVYAGEDYDARLEPAGWSQRGFTNTQWTAAVLTNGPGGALEGLSCAAPPLGKIGLLPPVKTNVLSSSTIVYDLGQNASLMPQLIVSGPAGSSVRITPSELLASDGTVDRNSCTQDSVRPAWWQYTLNGSGTESWFPQFFYHGSRYLQVQLFAAPSGGALPTVQSIQGVIVHSTATPIGTFSCSNPLFNQIYNLVRWSQRNNMVSLMTDCPHRERLGWLEEVHLNGPSLRYNFDFTSLFSKIENDIADSQWVSNGFVPNIAPEYFQTSGSLTDPFHNSPEWGSTFILGAWQQYLFSGDLSLLQRHYAGMKAYVGYLTGTVNGNYIVPTDLGDWMDTAQIQKNSYSSSDQLTTYNLPGTAIYYADTLALAQMAQALGNSADAATYTQLAANIRTGFNANFFKSATGVYDTSSQTANAMPLALGMANTTNVASVASALVNDVVSRGYALTSGEIGFGYLLRALQQAGRADVIYTMNNQTNAPGYGYQIAHNATSLTERWDAAGVLGLGSQSHFMLGEIMEWFYHDLAGIQPDVTGPGFKKIIIQPTIVGDLTSAGASYNSIRGLITNSWSVSGNVVTMSLTIPPGATARVFLPTLRTNLSGLMIQESGVTIWTNGAVGGNSPGVTFVDTELVGQKTSVVWDVGSGNYQFIWNIFPPPSGLAATPANGQVRLTWNAVAGASGYNVKRAATSGGAYSTIANAVAGTNYTDSAVTNGGIYYYVVSAQAPAFESDNSFEVSATPQFILNFGFEAPSISTYQYNPGGASWTFTAQSGANGSGITANNSLFNTGNPVAPQGIQSAFLQGTGNISQTINGFVPGLKYNVTFAAAQRATYQNGGQTWNFKLDNTVVKNFSSPANATNYLDYSTNFTATATAHTLTFAGTDLLGGDNTVFLDNIRLVSAPSLVPPQLGWQRAGGQLQLFWAADHFGWHLEMQANPSGTGLGTNWISVPGSQLTNLSSIPIDSGNGNVFLRLVYP